MPKLFQRAKLPSTRAMLKAETWRLEPEPSTFAPSSAWSNKDMDPVPSHQRTWRTINYIAFWISDAANPAIWELASSMLAIGLSWRQVIPAIAVGNILVGIIMVLNGTTGARLRVPFPVLNRSSFGFWLSYFGVISRVITAMFWFGIQSYTGSEVMYQMLKALWPSLARLPNTLPASAHITTSGLLAYLLYWLLQFPFMMVSPQRIRWLFLAKAAVVPPAWLAMLVWALVKVPPNKGFLAEHAQVSGTSFGWGWLSAVNATLSLSSTYVVNIPDFTRYAHSVRGQNIQGLIIPVAFTFTCFIGISVTSAGTVLYGSTDWDPLHLIDHFSSRPLAFFASFSFLLATLGTNISSNSLSAGVDMMALCPRYVNIRRGQAICAIVGGWALCPWAILASASGFLAFMNGYCVFLAPVASIMITDYWLIHRSKVDVPAMYDPHGRYWYISGVNWRATLALLVSIPPNLPGLIHSINPSLPIGTGLARLYDFSYIFGFFVAMFIYGTLSTLWPARKTILEQVTLGLEDERRTDESESQSAKDEKTGYAVEVVDV